MYISGIKNFNKTSLPVNKGNKPLILPEKDNFVHQCVYFSGLSSVTPSVKRPVPCTETLLEAWKDPKARFLIEKSIRGGNFKYSPDLAEEFIKKIDELSSENQPCETIYSSLSDYFNKIKPEIEKGFAKERIDRVNPRVNTVKELLGDYKPKTMVDIGCGDGTMTSAIKNGLNLAKNKVTGLDVFIRPNTDFDFLVKKFDGKNIPFENNSQDLALLFLVLHHVENPLEFLKEIHRTLKPDGHLIVREFDAATGSDKAFNTVMDEMWYKVYMHYDDIPLFNNYHGSKVWKKTFEDAGFKIDKFLMNEPGNPYRPFMALLSKK